MLTAKSCLNCLKSASGQVCNRMTNVFVDQTSFVRVYNILLNERRSFGAVIYLKWPYISRKQHLAQKQLGAGARAAKNRVVGAVVSRSHATASRPEWNIKLADRKKKERAKLKTRRCGASNVQMGQRAGANFRRICRIRL